MFFYILSYIDIYIVISLLIIAFSISHLFNSLHKRNIRKARKILIKLNSFKNNASIFSYLRKIDPFIFEELLLEAFKRKGYKVIRNKKYTGDGGIDGKILKNDNLYFIQAKRYSSYVSAKHIADFSKLVSKSNAVKGYFIHTGKTGKANFTKYSNIEIISGKGLIELVTIKN